jgi:hypothetical protein
MTPRLNLERGFRRITAIVSLAIFVPGVLYALSWWGGDKRAWDDALKQPDTKSLVVSVVGNDTFEFSKGTPETEIPKEIERDLALGVSGEAFSSSKGTIPVSFVYQPAIPGDPRPVDRFPVYRPGHLYTVREILEMENAGTLPAPIKETIGKLRSNTPSRLPWINKPVVFGVYGLAGALGLAAGLATVPWILFFLLRWIFRGFGGDA